MSNSLMGWLPHRRLHHTNHPRLPTLTAFTFLLSSSASVITLAHLIKNQQKENRSSTPGTAVTWKRGSMTNQNRLGGPMRNQKGFGGPGSSPPSCRSKCGWCTPCNPVHVPIQPGLSVTLEYYPEAWRCKCGNKLFMP